MTSCEHCGQDIKEGFVHLPIGEVDMGDYRMKTCYSLRADIKDE